MNGLKLEVRAGVTGGDVRIWTEYTNSNNEPKSIEGDPKATKEEAKADLIAKVRKMGGGFKPGDSALTETDQFDDDPSGYKDGNKVEFDGKQAEEKDITYRKYPKKAKPGEAQRWIARVSIFSNGKIKIWVKLPK